MRAGGGAGSGSKIARCLALSQGDASILGALCSPPQGVQWLQCFLCARIELYRHAFVVDGR
jgi:hypothetical protein